MIRRSLTLLICSSLFRMTVALYAQETGGFVPLTEAAETVPALQRPVTVRVGDTTLGAALQALARAAELGLTYDRSLSGLTRPTSLDVRAVPVGEALKGVLRGTGLELMVSPAGEMVLRRAGARNSIGAGASLSGSVTSEAGGPIGSAQVHLRTSDGSVTRSRVSDPDGDYLFVGLPDGQYRLLVTHLGYESAEHEVTLEAEQATRLDVQLRVDAVQLDLIDVRAGREVRRERARFETEAGVTAHVVGGRELKLLPGFAEPDVIRAVQVLPGVVSTSDLSGAFNVRGGSADQNLILLDGFPVFNPFHFLGLFSVFNGDVVELAELQSGGFGAEYGGRASSVRTVMPPSSSR